MRRLHLLPTLLFPFLLCTCGSAISPKPPLNMEQLAPVLADMQIAEALTNEIPVVVRDSMREVLYDRVLADHQTNRVEFDSLMWIVRQEPAWVDSLYTKVGEILAVKAAE